ADFSPQQCPRATYAPAAPLPTSMRTLLRKPTETPRARAGGLGRSNALRASGRCCGINSALLIPYLASQQKRPSPQAAWGVRMRFVRADVAAEWRTTLHRLTEETPSAHSPGPARTCFNAERLGA